jgi:CHASE3 domain sensor protein
VKSDLTRSLIPNLIWTVVLIALVGIIMVAYVNTQVFLELNAEMAKKETMLLSLRETFSDLKDAETGARGYVIMGDDDYLAPYHQALRRTTHDVTALKILLPPEQFAALEQGMDTHFEMLKQLIERRQHHGIPAAQHLMREQKAAFDTLRQFKTSIETQEEILLAQKRRDLQTHAERTTATIIWGTLSIIVLAALWFVVRLRKFHANLVHA